MAPVVQTAASGRPLQQQNWPPPGPNQVAAPQSGMRAVPLTYAEVGSSSASQQQPVTSAGHPPPSQQQQQQQQQPMRRKLSDVTPLSGVQPAGPSAISAGKPAEARGLAVARGHDMMRTS